MTEFLLKFANKQGFNVKYKPLQASDGRLKNNRIAIREGLPEEYQAYIIAHELAHAYIHEGDTINSPLHSLYEKQADKIAILLIDLLKFVEEKNMKEGGRR